VFSFIRKAPEQPSEMEYPQIPSETLFYEMPEPFLPPAVTLTSPPREPQALHVPSVETGGLRSNQKEILE
jgi:hypothetical protein